ncbi:MAG: DUF2500 family protein [Anaerovorax sp.]|nr:DUF2500 family protein [Anaerovorax sp.]
MDILDKIVDGICILCTLVLIAISIAAIVRVLFAKKYCEIAAEVLYKDVAINTSYDITQGYETTRTVYTITFQINKTRRITLYCGIGYYEILKKGDKGKLTYRGNRLIRFES